MYEMKKPTLTIFYQYNPWNKTIGGIQTLINIFIKYAPQEFVVRLVGTGNPNQEKMGTWRTDQFIGREIEFFPVLALKDDNVRTLIPTTIKYTMALAKHNFASDFMHFHRLEPTFVTRQWQGEKTLFIHNDIQTQMQTVGNKKAILWRRFPAAYFALEKSIVGQFNQILSCNTDAAAMYRQRYPQIADRIAYIKNSFDNEIFYPIGEGKVEEEKYHLAEQLGLDKQTRFILFAGRLHPQKDPLLLVRALAVMEEPSVHLLIAGDGELASPLKAEISQLGMEKQVTMLGAVTSEELAKLHRISHTFVLSSAYEGLPLVVLEALACGTPVVTTKCGETPKILTADTGVVCSEGTPQAIADGLRQVVLHPENYPQESCIRLAQPYAARTVVKDVYQNMFTRWQQNYQSPILGSKIS
ncbi:Glycosyl transferase, group 1 [Richelia intracellularis]|nr:Glycosyl transferase, group 1 [Richelia intracellularis]